jgi:hypothetical protein
MVGFAKGKARQELQRDLFAGMLRTGIGWLVHVLIEVRSQVSVDGAASEKSAARGQPGLL